MTVVTNYEDNADSESGVDYVAERIKILNTLKLKQCHELSEFFIEIIIITMVYFIFCTGKVV